MSIGKHLRHGIESKMKCLLILSIFITLSHSKDDKNIVKHSKKTLLQDYIKTGKHINKYPEKTGIRDEMDARIAKSKAKMIEKARKPAEKFNKEDELTNMVANDNSNQRVLNGYRMDSILNMVRRQDWSEMSSGEKTETDSQSSSRELKNWKTEFQEKRAQQKIQGWSSIPPNGDIINMVAARPWGIRCGDPSQHDMPWGSCVLPVECDAEYRIYRGDYFCGRTHFICCSLHFSTYDTYQANDMSLEDSELQTDTAEMEERKKNADKNKRDRAAHQKKRRKRLRETRKKKIRNTIKKIVEEVRKVLSKAYTNGTKQRKKKTKTMKRFIKYLKAQYMKDRDSAKQIHENQMYEVDSELLKKINQISQFSDSFMNNATFRDIVVNGTMTARSARMLVQAYPELTAFINADILRRAGIYKLPSEDENTRSIDVKSRASGLVSNTGGIEQGYATPPTGLKIRRSGKELRRSRDALRRMQRALRRSSFAMRRGGVESRPYRRRRKHRDYDVEYGLMYS